VQEHLVKPTRLWQRHSAELHQMGRTSRITVSVRERAKDAAMIEEQPETVLPMVREAIEMLTAARA
jgi:hypothetical protein